MDKIKDFFKKKKVDAKFKMAGQGHSLASAASNKSPKKPVPKQEVRRSPDQTSKEIQQIAAQAALRRLEVNASKQNVSRSNQAIKLIAKRQLDAEQHDGGGGGGSQVAQNSGPEQKEFDSAPVLAVNGVFFTCELLGDDLYLTKDDMCEAVECFLRSSYDEDPIVSSSIMIHSLNGNHVRKEACIEVLSKYLDNLIQTPGEEKFRKIRQSNKVFQEKVSDIKGSVEFLKAVGFEQVAENGEPFLVIAPEHCDAERLTQAKECLVKGEPMPLKLYRNPLVFLPSAQSLAELGLPRDFFERTATDVKAEQQEKSQEVEKMLSLRTREMRERDESKRVYKYRYTLLRIRFPDGYMLQGTFKSTEKMDAVENFVRENIECDWAPFVLKDVRGETFKGVKMEKTLAELSLSPAAVLHFELDPTLVRDYAACGQSLPTNYLKRDLLEDVQSL